MLVANQCQAVRMRPWRHKASSKACQSLLVLAGVLILCVAGCRAATSQGDDAQYPGQPPPGVVLWGASQPGNADPAARLEATSGQRLDVRRTFHQWADLSGSLPATARRDVALGRIPWVSIKTPAWASMATGVHDAEIDELLTALDSIHGPVWLTIHHEPEGGNGIRHPDDPSGPDGHLAMNRRVRSRMEALDVDNVALAPILMAWSWDERSGRTPDDWWDDAVYDFLGVDIYDRVGVGLTTSPAWRAVRRWAGDRGVDVAVGEWGIRGQDERAAQQVKSWHRAAVRSATDDGGARVVALCVYDNDYDDWRLRGEQLDAVRALVGAGAGNREGDRAVPTTPRGPAGG